MTFIKWYDIIRIRRGDDTHNKKRNAEFATKGMTPIEKNIIVVDEQGNIREATYPKRAKGLVKKGRARFISESMICLACPPEKLEENEMSDTQNKFENVERLIDEYVSKHYAYSAAKAALIKAVEDESFVAAVKTAVKNGSVGTAVLQRKLKLGYAKAAYMLDAMEALGLIGPPRDMQPREVLPEAAEYLAYKSK